MDQERLWSVSLVFMDWTRAVVVLQVLIQPCLSGTRQTQKTRSPENSLKLIQIWLRLVSGLFTVEAEQDRYQSEFGGDVVLGCSFQPGLSVSASNLKVTWNWISSSSSREVYRLDNWVEQTVNQDPVYQGRATLLREELENNWAKLKVPGPGRTSSVRVQVILFWSEPTDSVLWVISPDLRPQDQRLRDLPVPGPDRRRSRLQGGPVVGHR